MDEVSFRFAEEKDISLVLDFVKKLAIYVDRLDDVVATPDLLKRYMFEEKSLEVLFVLENGKEVGFASFFTSFSTFMAKPFIHLEDLFIDEGCRGKGYGTSLIRELSKIVIERDYGKLEWNCLLTNQSAIDFYISLGANQENLTIFNLTDNNLKKVANDK